MYNACRANSNSGENRGRGGDGHGGNGGKGDGFHPNLTTSSAAVRPGENSKMSLCECHGILNRIIGQLLQHCTRGERAS
jgi:hypothetical protein